MTRFISVIFILCCVSVIAQTNTNTVPIPPDTGVGAGSDLWLAIIPLVVPIIVEFAKRLITILPSWSLSIIAAGLGELLNYISGLAGGPTTTVLNGVILGSAGVGLREIIDQLNKKRKGET